MDRQAFENITKDGEHQRLEFKLRLVEGAVAERVVLGMANTSGGTLLVGVNDNCDPVGISDDDLVHSRSIIERLQKTYPELTLETETYEIGDSMIFSIGVTAVESMQHQISDRSGRIWHRLGDATNLANANVDFQSYRSNQRLPFGALKSALEKIQTQCAYPGCEVSDPLECASISSLEPGGPRFAPEASPQNRHALSNFVLLCPNHHVIVDRDPETHTLEWMLNIRNEWLSLNCETSESSCPDPPTCFLSYAWENDEHVKWVACLACELQSKMGVSVLLDSWELRPGDSITQFMENAVEDSDFVTMVLTPAYAKRAKAREGGVGYEGGIVTGNMLDGRDPRRFVPILRGDPSDSIPAFLRGKMYIDFRNEDNFAVNLEELGRAIHDAPKSTPPPLGRPPWQNG